MKDKKCLSTFSTYLGTNKDNYKIIDKISFESKNVYNHYMFCLNFYNKFKNDIYKNLYNKHFINYSSKKITDKINLESKYNFINDEIQKELFIKYKFYSDNYKTIINNSNIIYKYIIDNKPTITDLNFEYYKYKFLFECIKLDKISLNIENYNIVYHNVIENILITFYKNNYFNVKYSIINKKPFREELNIKTFINHVLNNKLKYDNDITKTSYYYIQMSKIFKINSEQNIIRKFALKNYKHDFIYRDIVMNIMDKCYSTYKSYIVYISGIDSRY
jgi:hypothetical protein